MQTMAFSSLRVCLVALLLAAFCIIHLTIATGEDELDDLDLLELDLEDPDPSASSSSSVVSLAQQKKALVQLTDYTAPSFLASNQHVLLLGYASWCTRSAELMPEFAAAAILLQESGIPVSFAKLDAVASQRIATLYNIKGFPTVLFFANGSDERYTGGFTRHEIVVWVKKHIGMPATTIFSAQEADEVLKRDATTVIGFFKQFSGPEYEAFIRVAMKEDETEFIQVDNMDLAKLLNLGAQIQAPFLSIIKNEPETYVSFEDSFDENSIGWFVESNKRPLVTIVNRQNHMKLYASPIKLQVTLFADADSSRGLLPLLREVGKLFKGQILFLIVDTADEELSRPTLMLYGMDADEPVVTAFNYGDGSKFLLEESLTLESLKEFCKQLVSGARKPYYKSQPIPLEEKEDVQIVVGKSFESIVMDTSKDVFLEVYTDWCAKCDAANKAVKAIGKHFKDVASLIIAKIDASANEHPLLQVEDYPYFLFYPANKKTNPIPGPKKWSTKKLVQFIHKHATVPLTSSGVTDKDEL
ncbi:hypothetical protein GOP47_0017878 [Adiantum capillus-veneris]|uniref:protein disulfide-isomerase n=1 Tax=Adiantum capillus-veneris TaxID=13818 RepID=A0A9D4UGG0_ADICA|nr:hypothetical protein GOP47_0017878 [Adiantum capillus-veneris]